MGLIRLLCWSPRALRGPRIQGSPNSWVRNTWRAGPTRLPIQWAWGRGGGGHWHPTWCPPSGPRTTDPIQAPLMGEGTSVGDAPEVSGCWARWTPPCTTPALSRAPITPETQVGPRGGAGGLQVPLLRGGRLGGVEHLLPALHPRHGLHVLPPVAHLHRPLLWAGGPAPVSRTCTGHTEASPPGDCGVTGPVPPKARSHPPGPAQRPEATSSGKPSSCSSAPCPPACLLPAPPHSPQGHRPRLSSTFLTDPLSSGHGRRDLGHVCVACSVRGLTQPLTSVLRVRGP